MTKKLRLSRNSELSTAEVNTHRITREGTDALRLLLGAPVPVLYAPSLTVNLSWYAAPSFAVRVPGGEFINIESECREGGPGMADYYLLKVSAESVPLGIPWKRANEGNVRVVAPFSEVVIGPPRSPVVAVQILEVEEKSGTSSTRYDSGLVFSLADKRRFAVVAQRSITGYLECSTHPAAIDQLLLEESVRSTLQLSKEGADLEED